MAALSVLAIVALWRFWFPGLEQASISSDEALPSAQEVVAEAQGRDLDRGEPRQASAPVSDSVSNDAPARAARPSTEPDALGNCVVFGYVVYAEDDSPAAGASVFLGSRETIADEDGWFTFEELRCGPFFLSAQIDRPGLLIAEMETRPEPGGDNARPCILKLAAAAQAAVLVVDDADAPLADVRLELTGAGRKRETVTDGEGRASVTLAPGVWRIAASLPGFATQFAVHRFDGRQNQDVLLRLSPGGALVGRVTDQETGRPVQAKVGAAIGKSGQITEADEDGRYRLENLPLDRDIHFYYFHDSYRRTKRIAAIPSATRELTLDMTLLPAAKADPFDLRIVVVDKRDEPIMEAIVYRDREDSATDGPFPVDQDGLIVIPRFDPAEHGLTISAPGFESKNNYAVSSSRERREIIQIKLSRLGVFRGRIMDRDGQPIEGALVEKDVSAPDVFARTDRDGRFVLENASSGLYKFLAEGYSPDRRFWDVDSGEQDIVLEKPGLLWVRIIDAKSRQPIQKFTIQMMSASQSNEQGKKPEPLATIDVAGEWFSGVAIQSQAGEFRMEGLRVGVMGLAVKVDGYETAIVNKLRVEPEDRAQPLDIAMERGVRTVAGVVADPDGAPVAGARVALVSDPDAHFQTRRIDWHALGRRTSQDVFFDTADQAGAFRFENIPAGTPLDLGVQAAGFARTSMLALETRSPEALAQLNVVALPEARIVCRVNRARYPMASSIKLYSMTFQDFLWLKGETGVFDQLGPGPVRVVLRGRRAESDGEAELEETTLDLEAGETVEIDWGFEAMRRFVGQVLVDGKPMAASFVFVHQLDTAGRPQGAPRDYRRRLTDAQGRFAFGDLADGQWELVAFPGEPVLNAVFTNFWATPHRETFAIAGADGSRVFRFTSLGSLVGRLVQTDGELPPLSLAQVSREGEPYHANVEPDPDGRFLFEKTPPGEYRLSAKVKTGQEFDTRILAAFSMPGDGEPLDLGDLPLFRGRGRLELTLANLSEAGRQQTGRGVMIFADRGRGLDWRDLVCERNFGEARPGLVDRLPESPLLVVPFVRDMSLSPRTAAVHLSRDRPSGLAFTARPAATLFLNEERQEALSGLHATRLADGSRIDAVSQSSLAFQEWLPLIRAFSSGLYGPGFGLFSQLEPGRWRVEAIDARGRVWRQELDLTAGRNQAIIQFQ